MFKKEQEIEKLFICFYELICILISVSVVKYLPYNDLSQYSVLWMTICHIALFYVSSSSFNIYRRGYLEEAKAVVRYQFIYAVTLTVVVFVTKGQFYISRRGILYFVICNTLLMYSMNCVLKAYRKKVYPDRGNSKKLYLVTSKERLPEIFERVENAGAWGGKITAIALINGDGNETEWNGIPIITKRDNFVTYAEHSVVDEVLIHLPREYEIDQIAIISEFQLMGVPVSFNINSLDLDIDSEKRVTKLAGFTVITFSSNVYSYRAVVVKRMIDIIGALVGLIVTGVVSIVVVPLIKLESKGPAIFKQKRVGKNGRVFTFYKFRSMYMDAEERKMELMESNEMEGLMFKMENDPRITKIGRFLRRTSLDELPQFYNVLCGDMSLVGTRPPTLDEYQQYEAYQKRRLSAKPGLTGLWQVSGRSNITNFNEVVKLDLQYIDNWSIWVDLKIILKTLRVLLVRGDAK